MAFSKNVNALISNTSTGVALKDFLATTQDDWANTHMLLRYNAAPPTENDEPFSFVHRCHNYLRSEHAQLRAWFTEPDYKLSILLQSKFLSFQFNGALDDGFGWDFGRDGDPEPRMIRFKSILLSCQRQLQMFPIKERKPSNSAVAGIARLIRAAFVARSEINMWRAIERRRDDKVEVVVSGEDLAKRWVSFRTMAFLVSMGLDASWSWLNSGCGKIFGPVDEIPAQDTAVMPPQDLVVPPSPAGDA
jgi:hypothetical protein